MLKYGKLQVGGGNVIHYGPSVKKDGTPLSRGYIAIHAESAPVQFRKIEIRALAKWRTVIHRLNSTFGISNTQREPADGRTGILYNQERSHAKRNNV